MKTIITVISFFCLATFANASTTIDAKIIRNQEGSGFCLISSGFPVPPGLVTEKLVRDGKVRIVVGNEEMPANVMALRGRHSDGTLRSMLIQFNRLMMQGEELKARVIIDGGTRTYVDPIYQRPTLEIVTHNNIIVPNDKNYLVTTGISLRGLIPEGAGSASEERLYTAMASDRFNALSKNQNTGTASYEHVSALISLWARSGDIKYQKEAVKQVLLWLPYNTPLSSQNPPCRSDVVTNPDGRNGGQDCGLPSEWYFPRMLGYAQMYLLTGYRDFWGIVAFEAQYQQWNITDQATAFAQIIKLQEWDTPRFNYSFKYGALLAALMIDATIPVNGPYFTGRPFNWENQIRWTIDALQHYAWDFNWIPFSRGAGTVPTPGTVISQGGVTATLLGVYQAMHDPMNFPGKLMPTSGYLMVNNITGGSFRPGALRNISARASGTAITDYRSGLIGGIRSNSPRGLTRPPSDPPKVPIFQLIFPTNFLIDTYLYIYPDPRIPDMVKTNLDIILKNIRPKSPTDPYYKVSGGVWGNHQFVKPYSLEQPVANDYPIPFELPEYTRFIAFVLKTKGDDTVNGATYRQWYERLVSTSNVSPLLLTWQWKYFGQFYSWGIDAPWMMKQQSLLKNGPVTMRKPIQYNAIPGDEPEFD